MGAITSPSFAVTYNGGNNTTVNDGDDITNGISITGTDLVAGEEYTFRLMLKIEGLVDRFYYSYFDTPDGTSRTITLTSDNPTFTESTYQFPELFEVESQEYQLYLQRVEETTVGNTKFRPTDEQPTGLGLEEANPISFTVLDDELIPEVPEETYRNPVNYEEAPTELTITYRDDVVGYEVASEPVVEEVVEPVVEVVPEPVETKWNIPSSEFDSALSPEFELAAQPEFTVAESGKANGTSGDDFLSGTNDDDIIRARKGDDFVRGGRQADKLFGGQGNDVIIDGRGNDKIYTGAGDDFVVLGTGEDTVNLGSGDNIVVGYVEGEDTLNARGGIDFQQTEQGLLGVYDNGTVLLA